MSKKPFAKLNRRYYLGILTLLVVVFIWVATSFVTNSVFGEQNFERPFFITYFNTSTFSLYLVPFLISHLRQTYQSRSNSSTTAIAFETEYTDDTERLLGNDDEQGDDALKADTNDSDLQLDGGKEASTTAGKMSLRDTIQLSAWFCILWFLANYCTNASLAYTTVGSSTILSSMSGLFTLGFGVLLRVEQFSWIKVFAVGISFIGVVLVSWSDQLTTVATHDVHNKLLGDLLSLAGAMFYGIYTVLLRLRIGDESRIDMPAFFGFVGLFNVVLLWPFFFILHWLGLETFILPYNSTLWLMITLNALIGTFLSDYLWLVAMLMTSPLVVTLGITLTVPLALIGDIVLKHILPSAQYIIGGCFVVAGFLVVNFGSLHTSDQENRSLDDEETFEMIPHNSI